MRASSIAHLRSLSVLTRKWTIVRRSEEEKLFREIRILRRWLRERAASFFKTAGPLDKEDMKRELELLGTQIAVTMLAFYTQPGAACPIRKPKPITRTQQGG